MANPLEDEQRITNLATKAILDPKFGHKLLTQELRQDALVERRPPKKDQMKWQLHPQIVQALLALPDFESPDQFLEAALQTVKNTAQEVK